MSERDINIQVAEMFRDNPKIRKIELQQFKVAWSPKPVTYPMATEFFTDEEVIERQRLIKSNL